MTAIADDPIKAYNEGLEAKYQGDWERSLRRNQDADRMRPDDEATLWNLAIAATSLRQWDEARRSWSALGIRMKNGADPIDAACGRACVRLSTTKEVVWGTRIDPARICIDNVPLPDSQRRYGDLLLNDGAPEGTRTSGGEDYPVFDELMLWQPSTYSTFEAMVDAPDEVAMTALEELCRANDLAVEDWGTIRMLCATCSRGNPGEHECTEREPEIGRFGFAACDEKSLRRVIDLWIEGAPGRSCRDLRMVLSALVN